jgi:hypothetical protein
MEFIFWSLILSAITGAIGAWIVKEKGRDRVEGFLFGFFLSIPGLLIEGLLPVKPIAAPVPASHRSTSSGPRFTMVGEKSRSGNPQRQKSMLNLH